MRRSWETSAAPRPARRRAAASRCLRRGPGIAGSGVSRQLRTTSTVRGGAPRRGERSSDTRLARRALHPRGDAPPPQGRAREIAADTVGGRFRRHASMKRPAPAGVVLFVAAPAGGRADVAAAVQIARAPQIGREDPPLQPEADRHGADENRRQRSEEACAARHAAILTVYQRCAGATLRSHPLGCGVEARLGAHVLGVELQRLAVGLGGVLVLVQPEEGVTEQVPVRGRRRPRSTACEAERTTSL